MNLFWRLIRVLWASSFVGIERSRYVNQRDLARLPIQHPRHYSAVLLLLIYPIVAAPRFPYLAMGKRRYREWTPTKEARLLHWMVLHPDSEWSLGHEGRGVFKHHPPTNRGILTVQTSSIAKEYQPTTDVADKPARRTFRHTLFNKEVWTFPTGLCNAETIFQCNILRHFNIFFITLGTHP